jgi:hypothetical protein
MVGTIPTSIVYDNVTQCFGHEPLSGVMTPGMLDMKRLYWNTRTIRGGKRKGKCPYEHLGLKLASYDFWGLRKDEFSRAL